MPYPATASSALSISELPLKVIPFSNLNLIVINLACLHANYKFRNLLKLARRSSCLSSSGSIFAFKSTSWSAKLKVEPTEADQKLISSCDE